MNTSHTRKVIRPFITLLLGMAGARRVKKAWDWSFLFLALLAITLGYWGFTRHGNAACSSLTGWEATLKTVQLFVLETSWGDLCSWHTQVAAFAAPLATLRGVLAAFGPRIKRWLEVQVLRLSPASDVFIGGGALAAGVAISLTTDAPARTGDQATEAAPDLLVGLDLRTETPLGLVMESCRMPCFVRQGDGLSTQDLRSLRLHSARRIWVATGDDHRNLEVAKRVLKLIDANPGTSGSWHSPEGMSSTGDKRVHLMLSVYDQDLVRAKRVLFPLLERSQASVEYFSLPRLAARVLWRRHPPPVQAPVAAPHILLLGTSDLAEALLIYAAQHGVYDERPEHCIRITVVGSSASAMHARLLHRFPVLAPDSNDPMLKPLLPLVRIQTLDVDEDELSRDQWTQLQKLQAFSTIYVACERDLQSVSAATRMASLRDLDDRVQQGAMPIVACLQQPSGSVCAFSPNDLQDQLSKSKLVTPWLNLFHVHEACIRGTEAYPGAQHDRWAMVVKAAYDHDEKKPPFKCDKSTLSDARHAWNQDTYEDFRWSNRLAADHIYLKLDLLASRLAETARTTLRPPPLQDWRVRLAQGKANELADELASVLSDQSDLLTWLLRLEHRRFVADRLIAGWLPAPLGTGEKSASGLDYIEQKKQLRLNHTLVTFDTLTDRANQGRTDEREKDRRIVLAIPEILRVEALS